VESPAAKTRILGIQDVRYHLPCGYSVFLHFPTVTHIPSTISGNCLCLIVITELDSCSIILRICSVSCEGCNILISLPKHLIATVLNSSTE
jgi:hypothetical protein